MEHKGHIGSVRYSAEDGVFHGKLQGIRDLVTYEGTDVASLEQNFRAAVDDYLTTGAAPRERSDPQPPTRGGVNGVSEG